MDWTQAFTIIGTNIALFGTLIGMLLYQDKKIEENRRETNVILRELKDEMKDFHGRLCSIEERRYPKK